MKEKDLKIGEATIMDVLKLCRECLKYSMGVFESMETRIDNIATYLDNFDERLTDVHQRSVRIENTLDEVQEGSVR